MWRSSFWIFFFRFLFLIWYTSSIARRQVSRTKCRALANKFFFLVFLTNSARARASKSLARSIRGFSGQNETNVIEPFLFGFINHMHIQERLQRSDSFVISTLLHCQWLRRLIRALYYIIFGRRTVVINRSTSFCSMLYEGLSTINRRSTRLACRLSHTTRV